MLYRNLLSFVFCLGLLFFISIPVDAQLSKGATAADWTLDDTNDVIHNLYTELNAGKGAILKFSATWCGPCWNYHNTNVLKNIYNNLGPNGTDEARVYYIESSSSTSEGCLFGPATCSGSTTGNWAAGTPYPLIHLDGSEFSVASNYQVAFFPTIYAVSPDKRAFLVGQASYNTLENWLTKSFKMNASATVTDALCDVGSIHLTVNEGFGSKSYQWSNNSTSKDLTNVAPGTYTVKITDANGYYIEESYTINGPAENVSVNYLTHNDVSCFTASDGSLSVFAQGGWSNNYNYQWSNGQNGPVATNLSGGLYTVTATDINGCTDVLSFGISEPGPLISLSSTSPASCLENNGVIDVFADGGTSPIYYEIAPGQGNYSGLFFQLAPGDYTINLTDSNGCTTQELVTVDEIAPPIATASFTNDLDCNQPTTRLLGTGSSAGAGVSYQWSTSNGNILSGQTSIEAIADQAGEYTLTVQDADGCQVTQSIVVQQDISTPNLSIIGDNQLTCSITTLELCVDTDAANSISWTQGANNSTQNCILINSAGLYEAQVTSANGCTASSTLEVTTSDQQPEVSISEPDVIDCIQTSTTLTATIVGNPSDYSIEWSSTDGNILSSTSSASITVDQQGSYAVEVTNVNTGCSTSKLKEVISEVTPALASFSYTIDNDGILRIENNSVIGEQPNWEIDGELITDTESVSQDFSENGTYEICLTVSNECGPDTYCEYIEYVTVLEVETIKEDLKCYDDDLGIASLNLTGGRAPYIVEWAGPNGFAATGMSISQLAEGEYAYLAKDDFGYEKQGSISIENAAPLLLDELVTINLNCYQDATGSISVSATGGTGQLSYLWDHGPMAPELNDLAAGSYTVNVLDENNCSMIIDIEITQPVPIELEADGLLELACHDDSNGFIDLTSTGGTGTLSYLWSDGSAEAMIENLEAGTISVLVKDENQCELTEEFTIIAPSALMVDDADVRDDINGNGGSIELDIIGGTGEYAYLWSNGETSRGIFGLEAGEYSCLVTDENNCSLGTEVFEVSFLSSTEELSDLEQFDLYPNPVKDLLWLSLDFTKATKARLLVTDLSGKLIWSKSIHSHHYEQKVNLGQLDKGMYLLSIQTAEGLATKKFMKL